MNAAGSCFILVAVSLLLYFIFFLSLRKKNEVSVTFLRRGAKLIMENCHLTTHPANTAFTAACLTVSSHSA